MNVRAFFNVTLLVGLGGSSAPPREMLEAWLALIESNPPDLAPVVPLE